MANLVRINTVPTWLSLSLAICRNLKYEYSGPIFSCLRYAILNKISTKWIIFPYLQLLKPNLLSVLLPMWATPMTLVSQPSQCNRRGQLSHSNILYDSANLLLLTKPFKAKTWYQSGWPPSPTAAPWQCSLSTQPPPWCKCGSNIQHQDFSTNL